MKLHPLFPECTFSPPNTIIFIIDSKGAIHEIYGDSLAQYELTDSLSGITFSELFTETIFSQIEEVLLGITSVVTISWKKNRFDVYTKVAHNSHFRLVYLVNITRFIDVESQLQESLNDLVSKKEELQAVFDLAANGISILNHNGMFLYANRFFQAMMGYTMEELAHHSCISLFF